MQTNVQPDNFSDEQFLIWNAIKNTRTSILKKYGVFKKVIEILSEQDGEKLGKRFMRPIEEEFASYEVHYTAEPDYERFRLRDRDDTYEFYLRKKLDGGFDFESFAERHPITEYMGQAYMLEMYLNQPSLIENCIAQIERYRAARKAFAEFRDENIILFTHCLQSSEYYDVTKNFNR